MTTTHDRPKSDGPRILCISPDFAPKRDSEAFCSAKFINALSHCGAQITVITYAKEDTNIDHSEMWNSVTARVIRMPPPTQRDPMASLTSALRFQTWLYARWVGEAVRQAAAIHRVAPFDIVYSRSLPMFGQIAGYWCSRVLKLPWIANLNDPWDYHQFPVGILVKDVSNHAGLSNFWMRRTLRHADLVTYPSERLRNYQTTIASVAHRSLIIPHVGNPKTVKGPNGAHDHATHFHLVHAGKLGSNEFTGRSTSALLEGLRLFLTESQKAKEITRFTLVGPEDESTLRQIRHLDLEGIVTSVGRADYEQSLSYIQSATFCVLVEAEMAEGIFLPSKVIDYISARKPILALSPRVGVVADLASGGGITRVDAGDALSIRDAIHGFYKDFKQGTLCRRSPSDAQVDQFRPELVARSFLDHLLPIVRARKDAKSSTAL
jgi:hypothetical protein